MIERRFKRRRASTSCSTNTWARTQGRGEGMPLTCSIHVLKHRRRGRSDTPRHPSGQQKSRVPHHDKPQRETACLHHTSFLKTILLSDRPCADPAVSGYANLNLSPSRSLCEAVGTGHSIQLIAHSYSSFNKQTRATVVIRTSLTKGKLLGFKRCFELFSARCFRLRIN
jgi:hypothetical protein